MEIFVSKLSVYIVFYLNLSVWGGAYILNVTVHYCAKCAFLFLF